MTDTNSSNDATPTLEQGNDNFKKLSTFFRAVSATLVNKVQPKGDTVDNEQDKSFFMVANDDKHQFSIHCKQIGSSDEISLSLNTGGNKASNPIKKESLTLNGNLDGSVDKIAALTSQIAQQFNLKSSALASEMENIVAKDKTDFDDAKNLIINVAKAMRTL